MQHGILRIPVSIPHKTYSILELTIFIGGCVWIDHSTWDIPVYLVPDSTNSNITNAEQTEMTELELEKYLFTKIQSFVVQHTRLEDPTEGILY